MEIMIDTKQLTALADAALVAFGAASYARSGPQRAAVSEFLQTANLTAIKELCQEIEDLRRANLDCMDHFEQMKADLSEAYRLIRALEFADPVSQSEAAVIEKARAFVEVK